RPKPRGFTVTESTTRGALRKLYATCQPPDAQAIEEHRKFEQSIEEAQQRAVAEQKQYVEQMKQRTTGAASDPGTLAMRRCVAAGREPLQCLGEVFTSGLKTMAGGDAGMGAAFGKTLPPGLRMTGIYGDGHFFLSFTEKTLWITCDKSTTQADYTVAMRDGQ